MSAQETRVPASLFPAAPLVLGKLPYDVLVGGSLTAPAMQPVDPDAGVFGASPSARPGALPDEEAFWAQAQTLIGETYRQFAQVSFGGALGRTAIAVDAPERSQPSEEASVRATATEPSEPEDMPEVRLTPALGTAVRVRRSNEFIEEGWVLARLEPRGRCVLQRGTYTKAIDLLELMILNPQLVPPGTPVRVPRSSGALDTGWSVKGVDRGLLVVTKPGVGMKGLTPEQFFKANPNLVKTDGDEVATSLVTPVVGTPVWVRRDDGEREPGWVVADHLVGMAVPVRRETPEGVLSRSVPLEELLEDNPHVIPDSLPLRVKRSNGTLDDGWLVRGMVGDLVALERPDVGEKAVEPIELIAWNRDRLLNEVSTAVGPDLSTEEGLAQAERLRQQGRLAERIVDGYWDASPTGGRPALVVHRGRDMALAPGLAFARELLARPEAERIHRLAEVVWQFMGESASSSLLGGIGPRDDEGVLIGDVPRMMGAGNNLARALMFAVMGAEAGLRVAVVRGNLVLPGVRSGHVWCEVMPSEGPALLIDLSVLPPPPGYAFPPADHPAIRACYVASGGTVDV